MADNQRNRLRNGQHPSGEGSASWVLRRLAGQCRWHLLSTLPASSTRLAGVVLGLYLVGLLGGCGRDNPLGRRAISGKITLKGAPLKQGSISFQPQQRGVTSSGAVITQGQYSIPSDKGLPPGKYKVVISASAPGVDSLPNATMPGAPVPPQAELIPPEYNAKSTKIVEVGEKSAYEFDFHIVGDAVAGKK